MNTKEKILEIKELLEVANDKVYLIFFARKMVWLVQTVTQQHKKIENYKKPLTNPSYKLI